MPQCMTVQAYKHILTPIEITKLTRSSVRRFYYQHLQKYFSLNEKSLYYKSTFHNESSDVNLLLSIYIAKFRY